MRPSRGRATRRQIQALQVPETGVFQESHPVDADGVVRVRLSSDEPLVGGWGWWDTRADTVLWSLAEALGLGEATLTGVGDATLVSPAVEAGLGISVYAVGPGPDYPSGPPAVRLSMHHGLPGLVAELLAVPDGGPRVARSCRGLVLFTVDEPEPVARVPIPDGFAALTLTGDGARLIGRLGDQIHSVSLGPDSWAQEARRRSGRGLSE